ncbi:MAG: hypothetical protein AB7F96_12850 [Beijerinckiaceae bacterium]
MSDQPERPETEKILEAARRDSESLFSGAMKRISATISGTADSAEGERDGIEKWGRITGRTLAIALAAALIANYFYKWF